MKVDGNQIQNSIKKRLKKQLSDQTQMPRLDIIYAGSSSIIETFTQLKQKLGDAIGVKTVVHTLKSDVSEKKVRQKVTNISRQEATDGVVVQLPLPHHLPTEDILNEIPISKDVDVLSGSAYDAFRVGDSPILPPVVGAIKEIFDYYKVDIKPASVAVVGQGKLVGQPVIDWLKRKNKSPEILIEGDNLDDLQNADVIISGAGDPYIIKPEHIKKGVVLLDAGTSQSEGGTKGDVHPDCEGKAHLYSPVPGGVGPITIARLFVNLVKLFKSSKG